MLQQLLEKTLEIDYDVFCKQLLSSHRKETKGKEKWEVWVFFFCVSLEPSQKWNKKICFLSIHIYAYPILCQWLAIFSYHNATQHCITNCRPNFVICKKKYVHCYSFVTVIIYKFEFTTIVWLLCAVLKINEFMNILCWFPRKLSLMSELIY